MAVDIMPVGFKPLVVTAPHATGGIDWVDTVPDFRISGGTGTLIKGMKTISISHPEPERVTSQTRSAVLDTHEVFDGPEPAGEWSMTCEFWPSGTAGTLPSIKDLLTCALGLQTVVGATSVTYSQQYNQDEYLRSFALYHVTDNGGKADCLAGCFVQTLEISVVAGGIVTITFSGKSLKHQHFLKSRLAAELTTDVATAMTLDTSAYGRAWGTRLATLLQGFIPATIQTADHLETVKMTSLTNVTDQIATIVRAAYGSSAYGPHLVNTEVRAWVPTDAALGGPLHSDAATNTLSLTAGGTPTFTFTSFKLKYNTGLEVIEQISRGDVARRHIKQGRANVSGSFGILLDNTTKQTFKQLAHLKTECDMQAVVSGGAGKILTLNMDYADLASPGALPEPDSVPEKEYELEFNFEGRSSADTATNSLTMGLT